jgi:hypothetical protein
MHAGLECGVIGEKASGHADDLVWTAYRGCAQPQRAAEDLVGGAVLGFPEGAAGAAATVWSSRTRNAARTRSARPG